MIRTDDAPQRRGVRPSLRVLRRVGGASVATFAIFALFAATPFTPPARAEPELTALQITYREPNAFADPPPRVGDLTDGDVLDLTLLGFEPGPGLIRLCDRTERTCKGSYPVAFGESGNARVQYQVRDSADPRGCTPCRLRVDIGTRVAFADLWFGVPAPPFVAIHATRAVDLVDGDVVDLRISGLAPGTVAQVRQCRGPAIDGTDTCGGARAEMLVQADRSGRAQVQFAVHAGSVGQQQLLCGRGTSCALVVQVDGVAQGPAFPLSFAAPPGASYETGRLLGGLLFGVSLLLLAVVLFRRTNWAMIGDGAAPTIDEAEYADLDAIIAALPPNAT